MTSRMRAAKVALVVLTALPIVFLYSMMQMSQLTQPFWDHWEQSRFIVTYYDRGLWAAVGQVMTDLSQHTRPVTVRMVFLLNGILTNWNIASEYIYMYAVLGALLLVHYRLVRRLAGTPAVTVRELWLYSVVVVLLCSPAGHNNHWWSWMLQLNLNSLLSVLALSVIAFGPRSWSSNAIAAVLCWLSVYTLTNGLFLILVVAGLAQLASGRPFRISPGTLFWIANIVGVYFTYFPIAEPGMTARPSLVNVAQFALVYLGQPIAALASFPYQNMFEPPPVYGLATIVGAVVLAVYSAILWMNRREIFRPSAPLLLLLGFGGFALASALGTGWARVSFDAYGVRNGASSRYVITGSLMLIAILYYALAERAAISRRMDASWPAWRRLALPGALALYAVFLLFSARAYADSTRIYHMARAHDALVARGFLPDASVSPVDNFLYPNQPALMRMRSDLLRLGLGPYRFTEARRAAVASTQFVQPEALQPGTRLAQRFKTRDTNLRALSLPFVTWGKPPSDYRVNWKLIAFAPDATIREVGGGSIATRELVDWKLVDLRLHGSPRAGEHEYELVLEVPPGAPVANPVGVALYAPVEARPEALIVAQPAKETDKGVFGLIGTFR